MNKNAYTLIEVLLTVFVLFLMFGLMALFQKNVFSFNSILKSGITSQSEGRDALKKIIREVRSASRSNEGAYPLYSATDYSFIFYSDTDDDGVYERLRYFLEDEILKRGVIIPSGTPLTYSSEDEVVDNLVYNIANGSEPIFTYYNSDYNGSSSPLSQPLNILDVRHVKVKLIIDANGPKPPKALTLESQTSIRNLKDNL